MKLTSILGAGLLAALTIGPAAAADASATTGGINVGTLVCHVDSGVGVLIASSKAVECTYKPTSGKSQQYVGKFNRLGLDVGFTSGGTVVWAVVAPGQIGPGALAGTYVGVSVEATAGFGVGANALVGGLHKSVALQPVSVQGQIGLSAAVAAAGLQLKPAK